MVSVKFKCSVVVNQHNYRLFLIFVIAFWRVSCESKLCPGLALLDKICQHISLRYRGKTSNLIQLGPANSNPLFLIPRCPFPLYSPFSHFTIDRLFWTNFRFFWEFEIAGFNCTLFLQWNKGKCHFYRTKTPVLRFPAHKSSVTLVHVQNYLSTERGLLRKKDNKEIQSNLHITALY